MDEMQWTTVDKSGWADGPWMGEPDKMQWQDEATGLPCLIVRNNGGALCGYVGVPSTHPWHGINYSGCVLPDGCGEDWCEHRPDCHVDVHGGLTFSRGCADLSPDTHRAIVARFPEWRKEAAQYPKGDAARRLRELESFSDDYDGWRDYAEKQSICHIPGDGEPDDVWWFGFDCAHAGDHCPGYDRMFTDGVYREFGYVRRQVERLAQQLAA